MRVHEVFVTGGLPSYTYNPRQRLRLEDKVREYLAARHQILSVLGPTKYGKTVLVRKIIPAGAGVWIEGGAIRSEDEFWQQVNLRLDAHTTIEETDSASNKTTQETEVSGGVWAPIARLFARRSEEKASEGVKIVRRSRDAAPKVAGLAALQELSLPLIIDDFHYVERSAQQAIIRALKAPIFNGLPVILVAVPHRRNDVVRVETDMQGRVTHVEVPPWNREELRQIPIQGFTALNVVCPEDAIDRIVAESLGSPHLVQDLCRRLCLQTGVVGKGPRRQTIEPPADWAQFFKDAAIDSAQSIYNRLARGPRQRSDRKSHSFADGTEGDIYVAVLRAVASAARTAALQASGDGPPRYLMTIEYEAVRASLRGLIADGPPEAHQVTRVLDKMTEIALESEDIGNPVIEYDSELRHLHLTDPYFTFYLRWGAPDLA